MPRRGSQFMSGDKSSFLNIALIGGGTYCTEILEKSAVDYKKEEVNAHIVAVADPDPESPGIQAARRLGLRTLSDYHDLYLPEQEIDLLVLLTSDQGILDDVLNTKPPHIRVQAYHVLEFFWKLIGVEERKLRERNEEVETILNGIQEFIIVLNPDMEVMEVNETFLAKRGYSRDEVIGKRCHEIFQLTDSDGQCEVDVCPLKEVIKNKRPCQHILTRKNSDGELRYNEVTIFPIWEKSGKISKFIEISRDVTDRMREEEEITQQLEEMVEERTRQLKETHAKLLHQDKMASLGKLSASVVHEINNPIAGMLNFVMLMRRMLGEGPIGQSEGNQFDQYLGLMETETRRISRIVSNLLAFSRQSKIERKPVDLNRIVEKTLLLNSNLLKINNVTVQKRLDENLPELTGSEDQLQQVFMNLISNTVEALEPKGGGTLSIETKALKKENKIKISFQDSGIGVPEENLPMLFEPFFTTKRIGKGVGLGLSVVYGIIEELGGSIRVDSEIEKGTTFIVELPVDQVNETGDLQGEFHGRH